MSDFLSNGWSLFVAGIVIGGLLFCLTMLIIASRRTEMANDNTTGHVWDEDLKEMNNPLPRWWMGLFVMTVVFAAVYLAIYPGLGSNAGTFKWSAVGQLEVEQAKARQAMSSVYAEFANKTPEQLGKDAKAMAIGERLFVNNCAQCHGADARGSKSFPNLADTDWLGGSGAEYVHKTIAEGRTGVMPPMAAAVGSADDVKNVANYVLSLSNSPHNSVAAQLGKAKFGACAACHGATGTGNHALGAPNLSDKVWLHGWGEAAIIKIVNEGKTNVMPPQGARFTPEQMKVLTAYVLNLSQRTPAAGQ
ncbi:MAG: cytochrome-c oxidase, cbb3-type subunit III [Ideonella sp. MAG2]|nr:MAG: cytochrome-c oxidase, cbb3-type subunit III [Ideonella sp. MAG2]